MAEEAHTHEHKEEVESTDRGLFDFLGKKKEEKKPQEEALVSEFDQKVQICEPVHETKVEEGKHEEKKQSLLEKLHRSDSSSSSSSSEEEVEEGGEKIKRKKKKGLKEKFEEKKAEKHEDDTSVPIIKCDDDEKTHAEPEEKKGFLDKIKEKLPGHKKTDEVAVPPPAPVVEPVAECATSDGEGKEKKGFLEKIKEKLPGYHPKTEEEKEKEKETPAH